MNNFSSEGFSGQYLDSIRNQGYCVLGTGDFDGVDFLDIAAKFFGKIRRPMDNIIRGIESSVDNVVVLTDPDRGKKILSSGSKYHHEDACVIRPPEIVGIHCIQAKEAELSVVDVSLSEDLAKDLQHIKVTHSLKNYRPNVSDISLHQTRSLVQKSPVSGVNCFFACELFTSEIANTTNQKVKDIFDILTNDDRRINIPWVPGKIVFFDNYRMLHKGNQLGADGYKNLEKVHLDVFQ